MSLYGTQLGVRDTQLGDIQFGSAPGVLVPVLVQKNTGSFSATGSSTIALSFTNAIPAHHLLIAHFTRDTGGTNGTVITSVTDNASGGSNTWVAGPTPNDSTNQQGEAVYYCADSKANVAGMTVTVTFANSRSSRLLQLEEWANCQITTPLDGTPVSIGGGTGTTGADNLSPGAFSTTQPNSLVIGALNLTSGQAASVTPAAGFTKDLDDLPTAVSLAMQSKIQTVAGSVTASWTQSVSGRYNALALAFKVVTGATQYTQSLTGSVGFTSADAFKTATSKAAALGFIGNQVRLTATTKTAALNFTGNQFRRTVRTITAALSFTGSIAAQIVHLITFVATLAFVSAQTRFTNKNQQAALSFTGSQTKSLPKSFAGSLSFTGVFSKRWTKIISAVLSFSSNQIRKANNFYTGNLTFTSNQSRMGSKVHSGSLSFSGGVTKQIRTTRNAVVSFIGSLISGKSLSRVLTATLSFTGNTTKLLPKSLSATLSFTGNILKSSAKGIAASLGLTGKQTNQGQRTLTGSLSFTSNSQRSIKSHLNSALSFTGNLTSIAVHVFTKSFSATVSFTGGITTQAVHFIRQTITAGLSFASSQGIFVKHGIPAILSFTGSLLKRWQYAITAALSFSSQDTEKVGSRQTANLNFTSSQIRTTRSHLNGAINFAGNLSQTVARFFVKSFTASVSFIGSITFKHTFSQVFFASVSFSTALLHKCGKLMQASVLFVGHINQRIVHGFKGTLSFTVNYGIVPHLHSALSTLRIKIFGKRSKADIDGIEDDGPIAGEEPGTK